MVEARADQGEKGDSGVKDRRWTFGPATLDERSLELCVQGRFVDLERKPLEVLLHLLNHAGQMVTKDQLLAAVWPRRILSDSALTTCVAKLRTALQDREQNLIKTMHGYGYRLVAPVEVEARVAPQLPTSIAAPARRIRTDPIEAERRYLTVLSCELVGSAQLSQRLDPEVFREVVRAFQGAASAVIQRYEGHPAQILSDGLCVYFGYPNAHDDDAERAARAAYDIVAALARLNKANPVPVPWAVRIGIHTGPAVVEYIAVAGRSDALALGETPDIAATLRSAAEVNQIIISDTTMRLVPGLFVTRALPAVTWQGLEKPVQACELLQPTGVRSRLETAERLTPFAGRELELDVLRDRWNHAQEGHGQAVLITAEPGLGKSRLLLRLREILRETPHTWLESRASPLNRNSAYQPIIESFSRRLAIKDSDTPDIKLQRLEQSLDASGMAKAEAVPLLASLLGLNQTDAYPPTLFAPEPKRQRTMELLVTWVTALAKEQPLALMVEDLHWADPSTLEVLIRLLGQIATSRMFVVLTARPEFVAPWPARSHITGITLRPLANPHVAEMLESLTRERSLPGAVQQRIQERAGGVPLFVEELVRTMLESGQMVEHAGHLELTGTLDELGVPTSLQGSLMARLDRLGESKHTAQLCAIIGREIPYRLLAAVAELEEDTLQYDLQRLTDVELLHQRGTAPESSYIFKHALIQDTAYNSLPKSTRQKLHCAIAQAIEEKFPERANNDPEVLATHFEKANRIELAVRYHKQASRKAQERASIADAIAIANHALTLARLIPDDTLRNREMLELLIIIGFYRLALGGYADTAAEQTFSAAYALLPEVNDPKLAQRTLGGLFTVRHTRADYASALDLATQYINSGRRENMSRVVASGHVQIGLTRHSLGELVAARESLEEALLRLSPEMAKALMEVAWSADIYVSTFARLCRVLWHLGYPDQAVEKAAQAQARAELVSDPFSICSAQGFSGTWIRVTRREPIHAIEPCQSLIASAKRYGFPYFRTLGAMHLGLAHCMLNRTDEGLALLRGAIATRRTDGALSHLSYYYGMEAEQCVNAGRLDEARAALKHGFDMVEQHNERFWEAELHRVKGELVLTDNAAAGEAEACFHKALKVSRAQQAKSLELRAATSLARLWKKQRRNTEARELLKAVYGWFTEGFDAPDLKDAKALLDEV